MRFPYRLVAACGVFLFGAASLLVLQSGGLLAPSVVYAASSTAGLNVLPGMPPVLNPANLYSGSGVGMLSPAVKNFPARVYVPNSKSDTVDIIDPSTYKIIGHFALPKHTKGLLEPQHVVPSWDLKKLWVAQDLGDQLTLIDPATAKEGETIHVDDPYNMYYTPDGKYAIVMAEREKRLDFRDAQTMKVINRVPVNCRGVNHADFSPDGKVFYIANMESNGVHIIDGDSFKQIGFLPTGKGAHGIYFSRDSKYMYVSNRGEGTVSLVDMATRKVATKWVIPGGGSPDMGDVSADGKKLWLSGRYNSEVYVFDTSNGNLLARIKVGDSPHGLCVYPQPGRYSLGHTGNMR